MLTSSRRSASPSGDGFPKAVACFWYPRTVAQMQSSGALFTTRHECTRIRTPESSDGTSPMPRRTYELTGCPVCNAFDDLEIADHESMQSEVELLWMFHERRLRAGVPIQH